MRVGDAVGDQLKPGIINTPLREFQSRHAKPGTVTSTCLGRTGLLDVEGVRQCLRGHAASMVQASNLRLLFRDCTGVGKERGWGNAVVASRPQHQQQQQQQFSGVAPVRRISRRSTRRSVATRSAASAWTVGEARGDLRSAHSVQPVVFPRQGNTSITHPTRFLSFPRCIPASSPRGLLQRFRRYQTRGPAGGSRHRWRRRGQNEAQSAASESGNGLPRSIAGPS